MMKNFFTFIILIFIAFICNSQMLNENFQIVTDSSNCKYYREVVKEDSIYKSTVKYITGDLKMVGYYSDSLATVENGYFKYYFANGVQESQGNYKNGKKVGTWNRWNFEGIKKPDRFYSDEGFVSGKRTTSPAKFPGGNSELRKYISDSLRYPVEAVKRKLSGTVNLSFDVDEKGEVENITVNSGPHYLLNEEAFRLISTLPLWSPAIRNGVPTKSQYIISIQFKL